MKQFDPEKFEIRFQIANAAVEQYEKQGMDFTLKKVAAAADLEVADIFEYFPNKREILTFYYEALIVRYRLMLEEIEGFGEYLLAEKLSNFAYTMFDMLEEHEQFVSDTFRTLIVCSYAKTGFETRVRDLFQEFFTSDERISVSSSLLVNDIFYKLLYEKFTLLVRFWIRDDSEGREVSMELTDRYTAFLQEIMYNAVADKGLELARLLFSDNILGKPFESIRNMFPEIEIRE